MASSVFKPLALIAGASVQTLAPRRIVFSPEGSAQKTGARTINVASSSISLPTSSLTWR